MITYIITDVHRMIFFKIIVDLEEGERTDSKTWKDLRFSESPREIPPFHEESGSRPPTRQSQVTSKENL